MCELVNKVNNRIEQLKIWLFDKKFICEICDKTRRYHNMTKHKHLKKYPPY